MEPGVVASLTADPAASPPCNWVPAAPVRCIMSFILLDYALQTREEEAIPALQQ